jgi:uncharacterized protein YrzB (UPF0473 family)
MTDLRIEDLKPIQFLRDAFGEEVSLEDSVNGRSETYRILAEFTVGGRSYAVLQSDMLKKDEEYALYRIAAGLSGEPELETITDDDEWEDVAELYDEWTSSDLDFK